MRRKVIYPLDMDGGCGKLHKQYIAASGHSAFAATTIHYDIGPGHVCGASLNAGSKKAAEAQAMARCTAGIKKFKSAGEQPIVGPCFIHMSK